MIIFNFILALTIILLLAKIIFSLLYYFKIERLEKTEINQADYTAVQPILSGDSRLEEDLQANLENTKSMSFLWLVDKSDKVAIEIVKNILSKRDFSKRVEVLYMDDVPQEINPKIFKLAQALDKIKTTYIIILDDDSVMDIKRLNELSIYEKDEGEWIATGIPFNYNIKGFYSKLISGFINSNSIFTYFSMSFLRENKTINGMFYIIKTDILKKYSAFEEIKYWLCDDLALAKFLLSKGVRIKQTTIFCNVRNSVPSFRRYILLMKRWLLFSNVYMKNCFSIRFLFMILLPTLLPTILLIFSLFLGISYFLTVINLLIAKVVLFYLARIVVLNENRKNFTEKKSISIFFPTKTFELVYDFINEFALPLMLIYTLITPPVILWRNKKIRVVDGKIRYEL
nr:glycosyltransferase [uncultured Fusobacterium sp.]